MLEPLSIKQISVKQKQFLKGLAHHLNATVMLGSNGLTEGVLAEIDMGFPIMNSLK